MTCREVISICRKTINRVVIWTKTWERHMNNTRTLMEYRVKIRAIRQDILWIRIIVLVDRHRRITSKQFKNRMFYLIKLILRTRAISLGLYIQRQSKAHQRSSQVWGTMKMAQQIMTFLKVFRGDISSSKI